MGELCCPTSYAVDDISHIPAEVMEISYGCGSPVAVAGIGEGESVLDLGSGGGIDCFIAARKVGSRGHVIGVDMTDEMLDKARNSSPVVAHNLGYDVVRFEKGLLEELPVEDSSIDCTLSNCVVNLAADKSAVMEEIYRVLKHGGRFCISDVVCDSDVPDKLRKDEKLWGACISGALREDRFMEAAIEAGFYGLRTIERYRYHEVKGLRFDSITLKGYKFVKGANCIYKGHFAVYNGPFSSVMDDEGHTFPMGVPVEVCTDTAERLAGRAYAGRFTIIQPHGAVVNPVSCDPSDTDEGGSCC